MRKENTAIELPESWANDMLQDDFCIIDTILLPDSISDIFLSLRGENE